MLRLRHEQRFPSGTPSFYYRNVVEERYRDFGLDMAILQNAFADTLEGLKKRKYPWETEWFLR